MSSAADAMKAVLDAMRRRDAFRTSSGIAKLANAMYLVARDDSADPHEQQSRLAYLIGINTAVLMDYRKLLEAQEAERHTP